MNEPRTEKARRKRIAVVAIHGVGDHTQFATAREIGDLLCNLEYKPPHTEDGTSRINANPSNTPRYAPFTEVMKRINVRPVKTDTGTEGFNWNDESQQKKTWGPMDALAQAVFHDRLMVDSEDNSPSSLDHQFMKGQLFRYTAHGPQDTYQCLRLEGNRVSPVRKAEEPPVEPAPDSAGTIASELRAGGVSLPGAERRQGSPATEEKIVHIYEMFWADLSKLGSGFTQIFSELYQVLFHLGSVSLNNVLAAAIHFHRRKGNKEWRRFSQAQWLSAAVLAWPIPILNLYMAALVPVVLLLSYMRTHLSTRGEFVALVAMAAALVIALCGRLLSRLRGFPFGMLHDRNSTRGFVAFRGNRRRVSGLPCLLLLSGSNFRGNERGRLHTYHLWNRGSGGRDAVPVKSWHDVCVCVRRGSRQFGARACNVGAREGQD